jgi:hypothetical protein
MPGSAVQVLLISLKDYQVLLISLFNYHPPKRPNSNIKIKYYWANRQGHTPQFHLKCHF